MKRSEINEIVGDAKEFLTERNFFLPPRACWSPEEWQQNKNLAGEVVRNMWGWDITDFGSGDFYRRELFLFTIRNGKINVDKKTTLKR